MNLYKITYCNSPEKGEIFTWIRDVNGSPQSVLERFHMSVYRYSPPRSGPKGHRPSEDRKAGRSFHVGPGGGHPRAHGRQLATGSDYSVPGDASP